MLHLLIRNGLVVDGTGRPAHRADVAIDKGKIVAIGQVTDAAHETIDAEAHVVTPGFIDSHTQMDAQMHWDPLGSISCRQGESARAGGRQARQRAAQREDAGRTGLRQRRGICQDGTHASRRYAAPILARWHAELLKVGRLPAVAARIDEQGWDLVLSTPDELKGHIQAEHLRWGQIIKTAKIPIQQ